VIDKDNIQELFSRSLENHTVPVRLEVWNGLQAKMAAASVSSVVAAKGISALAKWIIGSAAVTGAAVVTTFVVMNSSGEEPQKNTPVTIETTPYSAKEPTESTQTTPISANQSTQPVQKTLPVVNGQLLENRSNINPFLPINVVNNQIDQQKLGQTTQSTANTIQPTSEPINTFVFTGLSDENNKPAEPVVKQASQEQGQSTIEKPVIRMANVFTPLNQDNQEDEYYLIECKNVKSVEVSILNTENVPVYTSTDPSFHWNGRRFNEGDFVEAGIYACVIIYKDMAGKSHKSIQLVEIPKR